MSPSPRLRVIWNAKEAAWLQDHLSDADRLTSLVPAGFDAYARLLHPVEGDDGDPVRWADLAEGLGRTPSALMEFSELSNESTGRNPRVGRLPRELLEELCELLKQHTTSPNDCFFGLWVGYGWHPFGSARLFEQSGPLLRLPWREYFLFNGPVAAAVDFGQQEGANTSVWFSRSPNIWWPADHAWCVATEVDLDSTYLAGHDALITEIVNCPLFEAWRVHPGDDIP